MPQPVVERVLRDAVAELSCVEVRYGHRVVAAEDGPDGVRAQVLAPDGTVEEIEADYLLGWRQLPATFWVNPRTAPSYP